MKSWLVFIPSLPSSPSSLRVLVWRRMRTAGATALQQGVWVLPQTPEHERFLLEVLKEAQEQGGTGTLLVAQSLESGMESEVVARFHGDRDREYQEFRGRCQGFLGEIANETKAGNFTFAELEENEQDLHKLRDWQAKIRSRDFFGAPQAPAAMQALEACEGVFKEFVNAVYAREGLQEPGGISEGKGEGS